MGGADHPVDDEQVELDSCAVVGAGRVGRALVAADAGLAGPFGRGFDGTAPDGTEFDVILLAVPDREITAAASAIRPRPGRLVGHCSGATGLDVLAPHEAFGVHPLMTFAAGAVPARNAFAGTPAAVAGSTARAAVVANALARRLGMSPFTVAESDRAAYHAAASIASNFLVTLEDAAEVLLATTGLPRDVLLPLVRATVDNWERQGRAALTGPVARGDHATVERQRRAVQERAPELVELFDALVARTQAIAP